MGDRGFGGEDRHGGSDELDPCGVDRGGRRGSGPVRGGGEPEPAGASSGGGDGGCSEDGCPEQQRAGSGSVCGEDGFGFGRYPPGDRGDTEFAKVDDSADAFGPTGIIGCFCGGRERELFVGGGKFVLGSARGIESLWREHASTRVINAEDKDRFGRVIDVVGDAVGMVEKVT